MSWFMFCVCVLYCYSYTNTTLNYQTNSKEWRRALMKILKHRLKGGGGSGSKQRYLAIPSTPDPNGEGWVVISCTVSQPVDMNHAYSMSIWGRAHLISLIGVMVEVGLEPVCLGVRAARMRGRMMKIMSRNSSPAQSWTPPRTATV